MNPLVFVVGSCTEAFKLAPLVTAARAALPIRVLHLGTTLDVATARTLGLDPVDRHFDLAASSPKRLGEAVLGLQEHLAANPAAALAVQGSGTAAQAGALAARGNCPVIHLDAGLRTHAGNDDRDRRFADHAADIWLCSSTAQALNLRREGLPERRIHVVGSMIPGALAAVSSTGATALLARHGTTPARYLWLAIERTATADDPTLLREILAGAATAGAQLGLPVLALDRLLAAALDRHGLPLPKGVRLATGLTAADQLACARNAAVCLTDCGDQQELAAVAGIPSVVVLSTTTRPETVDAGCAQVAGPAAAAIARAVQIGASRRGKLPSPYPPDGPARALAALQGGLTDLAGAAGQGTLPGSAATGSPPQAAINLPSDGDCSGRTLGDEEVELVARAVRSGTLNSTKGTFVARFEKEFAARMGKQHAVACASGSAAVHCAIAALKLRPGDEVITTPITDMGALTPISYEGGVPVFADVDPITLNVTAATIARQITDRTRAIVVTHLFGLACEMAPILALAQRHGLLVVEDMAQAFLARERSGPCGTFGHLATFSLQQGKHMTTGEGGVVCTDDDKLAREVFLFVNKAWGYGDQKPDHYFPALNYRLTELQGAVAAAQLQKLDWVVQRRREVAVQITERLADLQGLQLPQDPPGGVHTFWKYAFMVDPQVIDGGAVELGRRMKERGVFCVPRYIQKPAFECQLYQDFAASPVTWLPLQHNPRRTAAQPLFHRRDYPGAVQALERVVVLPINELYTRQHVDWLTEVIRTEAKVLAHA